MPAARRLHAGCGARPPEVDGVLVGLDVDVHALAAARSARPDGVFVRGDACRLPLASRSIDHVELRAVLHHLVPVDAALAELQRVVAPGGTLTIIDGVALPPERARELNDELVRAGREAEPIAGFDVADLSAAVASHGFEVDPVRLDGTATFATRPIVSEDYVTDRFVLVARRSSRRSK